MGATLNLAEKMHTDALLFNEFESHYLDTQNKRRQDDLLVCKVFKLLPEDAYVILPFSTQ